MGDFGRDIQNEIEGIKPDEIEQMKIEAAIENIQKSILSRSHLYINVIFVIFGAYALNGGLLFPILGGLKFPTL